MIFLNDPHANVSSWDESYFANYYSKWVETHRCLNTDILRNRCQYGCPVDSYCKWGLCQCNSGLTRTWVSIVVMIVQVKVRFHRKPSGGQRVNRICSVVQATRAIQASACILHQLAWEVNSPFGKVVRWSCSSIKQVCWNRKQHQAGLLVCKFAQTGEQHPQHPHDPAGLILSLSPGIPLCQRTNFHRHLQIFRHQGSCSTDQHKPDTTFDPESGVGCTTANSTSACSNLDINLICHTSKLTCNCRRNMRWNPVANECQVRSWKYGHISFCLVSFFSYHIYIKGHSRFLLHLYL